MLQQSGAHRSGKQASWADEQADAPNDANEKDQADAPEVGGESDVGPGRLAELEAQIAELGAEVKVLDDQWRRALADLDNLRKRTDREIARARAEERAAAVATWLPVLDHLELALEHASADPAAVLSGVRAIRDEAIAVLNRLGVTRVGAVGVPFDPVHHEVVATANDSGAPPGTVVRVVRPGYDQGEGRVRPASVVVSTGGTQ